MSLDHKRIEKILDSLTLEDVMIILQLSEIIIKRFERYRSRFKPVSPYGDPRSQIFEKIFERMMDQAITSKQQPGVEPVEDNEEIPARIEEFVKKLRSIKRETESQSGSQNA